MLKKSQKRSKNLKRTKKRNSTNPAFGWVFLWYYVYMSKRNCIYTGLESTRMDKFVPKKGGDEAHNWSNSVPCSEEYKEIKGKRLPNKLETEAYSLFMEIESLKLKVSLEEAKLKEIQAKIRKKHKILLPEEKIEKPKERKKISKEKEIEIAFKEKEIKEIDVSEVLEKNKIGW